ncbi:TrlF family AAA-like ATPase [Aquimarina sp. 433]
MVKITRGSEWKKWDLHIHTPASGFGTDDDYSILIENLKKSEAEVIGINDYSTIDGYAKIVEKGGIEGKEFIPVVEFRMINKINHKNSTATEGGVSINFHIIFDNQLSVKQIQTEINSLECFYDGGEQTKLGHVEANKYNELSFDFFKTIEALRKSPIIKDRFLIWVPYDEYGGIDNIDPKNDGFFKLGIINKADILGSGNSKQIDFFLSDRCLNDVGKHIPCIKGSDSHQLNYPFGKLRDKDSKPVNRYCWIKADSTFQGLKQIVYEPLLRVKINDESPDSKQPHKTIKSLKFINHPDFINSPIYFSKDLNTIIGGKSSGKSLLLYYLANTIDYKYAFKQINPNAESIELEDKYKFSSNDKTPLDVEIQWDDDVIYKFSDRDNIKNRRFVYIPQTYILSLTEKIEKKSRKTLGKFIREILLQDIDSKDSYDNFIKEVKRLDRLRNDLVEDYFKIKSDIKLKYEEIKNLGDKEGIQNFIENTLEKSLNKLKSNSNITEQDSIRYNILKRRQERINNIKLENNNEIDILKGYINDLDSQIKNLIEKKNLIRGNFKQNSKFLALLNKIESDINELEGNLKVYNSDLKKLEDSSEDKARIISDSIEEKIKPISEKLTDKNKINNLEKEIKSQKGILFKIQNIEDSTLVVLQQNLEDTKNKIFLEYENAFNEYQKIIKKLNERSKEFDDLNLIGSIKFYANRFKDQFFNEFFNLSLRVNAGIKNSYLFKTEKNVFNDVDIIEHKKEIERIFDLIVNNNISFKKYKDKKDSIKALLKDEFFDYWELKVGNDEMADMSPGKANLVILKLLIDLSESDCPILIDQPEDNLDNRSIYNDLVQFIRKRKMDRQIIIVTHNPNVVVSADSENVIVANQKGEDNERDNNNYRFEYINGAIENSFKVNKLDADKFGILEKMGIKEHVTEILEGGEEAFIKREEKYGF